MVEQDAGILFGLLYLEFPYFWFGRCGEICNQSFKLISYLPLFLLLHQVSPNFLQLTGIFSVEDWNMFCWYVFYLCIRVYEMEAWNLLNSQFFKTSETYIRTAKYGVEVYPWEHFPRKNTLVAWKGGSNINVTREEERGMGAIKVHAGTWKIPLKFLIIFQIKSSEREVYWSQLSNTPRCVFDSATLMQTHVVAFFHFCYSLP